MSREIKDLTPLLQEVFKDFELWYSKNHFNKEVFLTCTHRPIEEQAVLYSVGRTRPGNKLTNCDGLTKPSKHNLLPSKAFDFGVKDNGLIVWHDSYFTPVLEFIKNSKYKDKIRSGGLFSFKDWQHIEEI